MTASENRWLFGPLPDLLLGCGLLYVALFLVFSVAGSDLRPAQPVFLFSLLAILVSMPHYGGTLLRVYEERESRRSYRLFAVWATLAVLAVFAWSVHNPWVGSLFLTVYLTWSPWHYTGQNYGLGVMFLRRRGVDLTPSAKRWLYSSFVLSYALVFLSFHGTGGAVNDYQVSFTGTSVSFQRLGIPDAVVGLLFPIVAGSYLFATFAWVRLLKRSASLADLGPTLTIALSQALWFSLPILFRMVGVTTGLEPLDDDFRRYYFWWIVMAHSVQYLWVTTYYARSAQGWTGYRNYLGKALLCGVAVWSIPFVIFAPDHLGKISYDGGLEMLVASAVNVHHFILDGAIWKLRNMRIARILIRNQASTRPASTKKQGPSWGRRLIWSVCGVGLCFALTTFTLTHFVLEPATARRDWRAAAQALDQMAWLGWDNAARRTAAALGFASGNNHTAALAQFERSTELRPSAGAWTGVAEILRIQKDWAQAIAAYDQALALAPKNPDLLRQAGQTHLAAGSKAEGIRLLERALALRPNDLRTKRALNEALRREAPQSTQSGQGAQGL